MTIKQIKLTSGEEVVCNIVDVQEEEGILIISDALKICEMENIDEGYSYFVFRPLMSFVDDPGTLQILNMSHIILESTPSENILGHYGKTLKKMKHFLKLGKTIEELEDVSDEEFEEYMATLDEDEKTTEKDPRGDNVFKFKTPKDTIH
jgi:hypothetical protein